MSGDAAMHRLSAETRVKLRSTQILTSLPQIISELLQNSIDSGASQIDIGLDCEDWSCWVRDDGSGFTKDGLAQIAKGSEESRYMSSKAHTPASVESISTLGFRGEALSSVADLCCLEISSRTDRSRESWSVILKGGQSLYIGPSVRWRRESAGTVVSVRDAFFNLPIRRLSCPSSNRTLEMVRQEIESYALVFPEISFSIQDTSKSKEGRNKQSYILRIPKTRSTLAAFRHLYGRAWTEHVEEIDVTCEEVRIEGFVSLVGAVTKAYQFLYINKHPVSYCDLHKLIDLRFSASSFAKHAYDEAGATSVRPAVRRSPRKGEKKPIYVLNLSIPTRHIDNCLEPTKTAVELGNKNTVSSFLSSTIRSFLVRHGFTSERAKNQSSDTPPGKKRRITVAPSTADPGMPDNDLASPDPRKYWIGTCTPFVNPMGRPDKRVWTDPVIGETFTINSGTGNSHPRPVLAANRPIRVHSAEDFQTPPQTADNSDSGIGEGISVRDDVPEWLREALKANDAYTNKEPKIPTLPLSLNQNVDDLRHPYSCSVHLGNHIGPGQYLQPETSNFAPSRIRFQKENLQSAFVINQVDRKFIACLISAIRRSSEASEESDRGDGNHGNRTLVLVDQHAADERVRVERFLRTICHGFLCHRAGTGGVEMERLVPPVPVLLTQHEASRLSQTVAYQHAFESWGFCFDDLESVPTASDTPAGKDPAAAYVQVFVSAIPKIVSEKLLSGNGLQELIKVHLGALEEGELSALDVSPQSISSDGNPETRWVKALRWCPRVLLDLINSKACRGAIMFNDPLNLEQCQRLIKQLSTTAFPFQCAHGRPSLVPLTCLTGQGQASRSRSSAVEWQKVASLG